MEQTNKSNSNKVDALRGHLNTRLGSCIQIGQSQRRGSMNEPRTSLRALHATTRPSQLFNQTQAAASSSRVLGRHSYELTRRSSILDEGDMPTHTEDREWQQTSSKPTSAQTPRRPSLLSLPSERLMGENPSIETSILLFDQSREKTLSNTGIDESNNSQMLPVTENYNELIRRRKKEKASANGSLSRHGLLEKDKKIDHSSVLPNAKWWHNIFVFSFISVVVCIIRTWAPYPYGARMTTDMVAETDWSDGCIGMDSCICPRETICADDLTSMILLTIARCSAWFEYPLYMCLFLSKANNLNTYLQKTILRCKINFSDSHKIHRLFGIIVGVESTSHSLFHLLRWARRNDDIQLLWTSRTGMTGLVSLVSGLFIVLPMTSRYLRTSMSFEWRKGLHYLAIVWALSLMYHAPHRIFWLIGVPFLIYLIDKAVGIFFRTFLIESAEFERIGDSICNVVFENPPGFGKHNSAYVYLMLPWLSTNQFHAFTIFQGPRPNTSSISISKCGDWSEALMKEIKSPTHKLAFVMGPYLSPFSSPAMDGENVISIASGIGVTPALSLLKKYSYTTRRMNLIWICRDGALVEHFLQSLDAINGRLLIYYTGKRRLFLNDDLPPDICLLEGRPDLDKTISAVIHSIAHDSDIREDLYSRNAAITKPTPEQRMKLLLERALSSYSIDQLFEESARLTPFHHVDGKELSGAVVSFKGVLSMMEELLGDEFDAKILKALDLVDSYGSSVLTKEMFEDFIHILTNDHLSPSDIATVTTIPSITMTENASYDKTDDLETGFMMPHENYNIETLLRADGKFSSKHWKMLYCGGSDAVLAQLRKYKRKHSIGLSVEKFDW